MLVALALLPLASATVVGCGGHHIGRRNSGVPFVKRQAANTNLDPTSECQPYDYPPVDAMVSRYPGIWKNADLVEGDTVAASLFASINATVNAKLPGVIPNGNGNHNGDWGSFSYPASDPNCWWTETGCTTPAASTGLLADITTMPEPETWGLAFDDGPNCSHNALYNFLQENKQRATMFYIGSNVMDQPKQGIRGYTDGHEICVHTWSHGYMTSFNNQQAFAELYYTQQAIKEIIGVTPKCWRPPYGDVDNRIRLIASLLNMTTIVWSDDTDDWSIGINNVTNATVVANYDKVINKAKAGNYSTHGPIVLNHEINNYTMQMMIDMYPSIKSAFKYIVPIASGYNITRPYMETNVTFPDFNEYVGLASANASASASAGTSAGASASSTSAAYHTSVSTSAAGTTASQASLNKSSASAVQVSLTRGASIVFGGLLALML